MMKYNKVSMNYRCHQQLFVAYQQDQRAGTARPVSFNLLPLTFNLLLLTFALDFLFGFQLILVCIGKP
jgi:hypothetical protein